MVPLLTENGRYRDGLAPRVHVAQSGRDDTVALRQQGPGSYLARVPLTATRVSFELLPGGELSAQSAARAGVRSLNAEFADELRSFPPNMSLLEQIAEQTGGRVAADATEIFSVHGDSGQRSVALRPWFA